MGFSQQLKHCKFNFTALIKASCFSISLANSQCQKFKDKYSQERNIKELMLKTSESGFNYTKIRIAPSKKRKEESKNSIKNILQMVQNYQEKENPQKQKEYTSFNPIRGLHRKINSTYQTYQTAVQDKNETLNESKKININQSKENTSVYKESFVNYSNHPLNSPQKENESFQNSKMYRDSGYFLSPKLEPRKFQFNLADEKSIEKQQQYQISKQIRPTRQTDIMKLKQLLRKVEPNECKENKTLKVNEIKPQILREQLFLNQKYREKRRHPSDQTFSIA